MLSIISPTPNQSLGCTFSVRGTCDGGTISIVAKDSSGNPISGSGKTASCVNGKYKTDVTVCGVNANDVITVEVSNGTDTLRVDVVMAGNCPAC